MPSFALETFRPTSGQASARNASRPSDVMLLGVGKRSISARNQSDRLLPTWIAPLQGAGARGLHPSFRRAGGSATPTSNAARANAASIIALTIKPDPPVGLIRDGSRHQEPDDNDSDESLPSQSAHVLVYMFGLGEIG